MSQANLVTVDYYRWLYDYSYWARDRVLVQVAKLDHDAYIASRALDYGSIRGTLVHWLAREAIWLDRWQGKADSLIGESDLPTFSTLIERSTREEARMRAFLNELSDHQLLPAISYVAALTNNRYAIPLWHMMSHVVNHGTQHRSEVALALTQLAQLCSTVVGLVTEKLAGRLGATDQAGAGGQSCASPPVSRMERRAAFNICDCVDLRIAPAT